jgi:hypothetical protein
MLMKAQKNILQWLPSSIARLLIIKDVRRSNRQPLKYAFRTFLGAGCAALSVRVQLLRSVSYSSCARHFLSKFFISFDLHSCFALC